MTWYTILHYEAISELWNTMYFPLQLGFKTLGNKDFKSLATVCRGKQWFIHIDDILLFKNDAIEFE